MVGKKNGMEATMERKAFVYMLILALIIMSTLTIYIFIMKPAPVKEWGVQSGDWMRYCGTLMIVNETSGEPLGNETFDDMFLTVVSSTNLGDIQNGSSDTALTLYIGSSPGDDSDTIVYPVDFLEYYLLTLLYASPPPHYLCIEQNLGVIQNWTYLIYDELLTGLLGLELNHTWVDTLGECDRPNRSYLGYGQDFIIWNFGFHHLWKTTFCSVLGSDNFSLTLNMNFWSDDQSGIYLMTRIAFILDLDGDGQDDYSLRTSSDLCDYGSLQGGLPQFGTVVERYYFWLIIAVSALTIALIPVVKKYIR
jgi:hypothetical protein